MNSADWESGADWESNVENTIWILTDLYRRALSGDSDSQKGLLEIAETATCYLALAAEKRPEDFKALAARRETWPGFIGPHKDHVDKNLETVEALTVGSRHYLKLTEKSKRWKLETPTNAVIIKYLSELKALREPDDKKEVLRQEKMKPGGLPEWMVEAVKLPKLTVESAKLWFEVIWKMILDDYNGHPERKNPSALKDPPAKLPCLRQIGKDREERHITTGSIESNIRYGIKKHLRDAFFRIIKLSEGSDD